MEMTVDGVSRWAFKRVRIIPLMCVLAHSIKEYDPQPPIAVKISPTIQRGLQFSRA